MNIEKETLINFKKSFDNLIEEDDGKLHNRLLKLSSGYIGSYESLILISSNMAGPQPEVHARRVRAFAV
jgi:hypothetical protein